MSLRTRLRAEPLETRVLPRSPWEAPSLGPPPPPGPDTIWVGTEPELQAAVQNLRSNQTVVVRPGEYRLTRPLYVGKDTPVQNVTIRGATDDFDDVVIRGAGMENPAVPFGISVYNAQDVLIANLSVGEVYYHALDLQGIQGADRVRAYHNRFFDAGEQILKSSAGGGGADDCVLEYNVIEFTAGPSVTDHGGGTGYTGGLHAHETDRWLIRDNLWRNVHTPDWVQHTFAPTVLMWNGSADTVVEGNTFVDCDRAVAFGLIDQPNGTDHRGGAIRNNVVYQRPGLFSPERRAGSDGQLLAYDSPGTVIAHNTVLTNGNSRFSLETRWAAVEFRNNLTDAPYRGRDGGTFVESGNVAAAGLGMFVNAPALDLRLVDSLTTRALVIDRAVAGYATLDWSGAARSAGAGPDVGALEFSSSPPSSPPPFPPPASPPPASPPPPPAPPGPPPAPPDPGTVRFVAVGGATDGSIRLVTPAGAVTPVSPFGNTGTPTRTASADVNGDGVADVVAVTGPGTPLRAAVLSGAGGSVLVAPFDPFGGDFLGGGYVAAADLDRDGRAEFGVTPDQGGGPRVTVFSRNPDGSVATRTNFFGIDDPAFRGGARVALGDVNGDGTADVVVAAGFGGGPRTAIFTGQSVLAGAPARLVNDFFAFPGADATNLRNGSFVAAGDVTGDGFADLVFGGGPGGAPRVFVLDGRLVAGGQAEAAQAAPAANFFVGGDLSDRGGARVGVMDANGDDRADVVVGSGAGRPARVRLYSGADFTGGGEPVTFHDLDPLGGAVLADGVYVG